MLNRVSLVLASGLLYQVQGNVCVSESDWLGDNVISGRCDVCTNTEVAGCSIEQNENNECEVTGSLTKSAADCCTDAGGSTFTPFLTCDQFFPAVAGVVDLTDCSNSGDAETTTAQFLAYMALSGCCGQGETYCANDNGPVPVERLPEVTPLCQDGVEAADLLLEVQCSEMTMEACHSYEGECFAEWDDDDGVCKFTTSESADLMQCCTDAGGTVSEASLTCQVLESYLPQFDGGCEGLGGLYTNLLARGCCSSGLTCAIENIVDLRVYSAPGCSGGYRVFPFPAGECMEWVDADFGSIFVTVAGDVATPTFYSDGSCSTPMVGPLENRTGETSFTRGECKETTNAPSDANEDPNESYSFGPVTVTPDDDPAVIVTVEVVATFANITPDDFPNLKQDIVTSYGLDNVDQVEIELVTRRRRSEVQVKITITVADVSAAQTLKTTVEATQPTFTNLLAGNDQASLVGSPTVTIVVAADDSGAFTIAVTSVLAILAFF